MPKKSKKKKRKPVPVPPKKLSPQEQITKYKKTIFNSNLAIAVLSALYIIGLHLPFFYPGEITSLEITGSISAMDYFFIPRIYIGLMALICSLSILSIALEKIFIWIIFPCVIICIPEHIYHLFNMGSELMFTNAGISVYGAGFYILFFTIIGILYLIVFLQINECYFKPTRSS
jgi:hypothetical protein